MATYAIGDIQGCYDELLALLDVVNFSEDDQLWLAGDLVNRGPKSLETLRFIKNLGIRAKVVLGNHDLHLLAIYYANARLKRSDTLSSILSAHDCAELMHWLKAQPLAHFDPNHNALMVHAGTPANWSIPQTLTLAKEVEQSLQSDRHVDFFNNMYGNTPAHWDESLKGYDRLRCITNYLTRMRFCTQTQQLDLSFKGENGSQPKELSPWFNFHSHAHSSHSPAPLILFGHWAALMGKTGREDIIALDTGCVWGEKLTAICLESRTLYSAPSIKKHA